MSACTFSRVVSACVATALMLPVVPAGATGADDLRDIVGAKGRDGEPALERRGYTFVDGGKSSNASYTYWWNNSQSACVRVTTREGRYASITDADASDCGQTRKETAKDSGLSNGAKVAIGAAALLGIAALIHKSHHRDDRDYDERQTADFERGFRDGMYNNSYHNYGNSPEYSDGYNKGADERREQSSYRYEYGHPNYGPTWVPCGDEGSFCSFRGSGVVRFGLDGQFVTRRGFNGMACNLRTFGDDPVPGRHKRCFVREDGR